MLREAPGGFPIGNPMRPEPTGRNRPGLFAGARPGSVLALVLASWTGWSACATTHSLSPDGTVLALEESRAEIELARAQVSATMRSLQGLSHDAPNHAEMYGEFQNEVEVLNEIAALVRERARRIRDSGETYFKSWDADLTRDTDPDRRARGQARLARAHAAYTGINKAQATAELSLEKLLQLLELVQSYFVRAPDRRGAPAASKLVHRTNYRAQTVQAELAVVAVTLGSFEALLQGSS